MSALDEIRKIPYQKRTKLDLAIMFYGDEQTADDDDLEKAEEAAAELLKLREEIKTLKELLYEAQYINMLSDGEGGGAWSVNGDLEQRIDKALEGFEIAH